ncbi:MAG TPA: hypothetical protein VMO26_05750 [Vicinamibacterales bacterium]|nr:hypothetical protein [Vicinamibacterales bacterium]
MADFNIRSEAVDVEQIMKQIRARIGEKRGVDYTEDQVRELATVRLETFLDPKNLRSDLLDQFRRSRPAIQDEPPPVEAPYEFSDETLFASHRGGLRFMRKLLRPILKLFFNPNTLNQILHTQAQFNVDMLKREQRRRIEFDRSRSEWNTLYYEVLHNLVLETTRNGIELKNMRMRVEALASRLDFSERRVRALEGVVQYRPEAVRSRPPAGGRPDRTDARDRDRDRVRPNRPDSDAESGEAQGDPVVPTGEGAPVTGAAAEGRRRRRRRRGRRGTSSVPGTTPADGDASMNGEVLQLADSAGGDDDFDGGEDSADGEPDVPSDPDAQ